MASPHVSVDLEWDIQREPETELLVFTLRDSRRDQPCRFTIPIDTLPSLRAMADGYLRRYPELFAHLQMSQRLEAS